MNDAGLDEEEKIEEEFEFSLLVRKRKPLEYWSKFKRMINLFTHPNEDISELVLFLIENKIMCYLKSLIAKKKCLF